MANLSPRYWIRRWLVPELEPSAQAVAECDAIRARMFSGIESLKCQYADALRAGADPMDPLGERELIH